MQEVKVRKVLETFLISYVFSCWTQWGYWCQSSFSCWLFLVQSIYKTIFVTTSGKLSFKSRPWRETTDPRLAPASETVEDKVHTYGSGKYQSKFSFLNFSCILRHLNISILDKCKVVFMVNSGELEQRVNLHFNFTSKEDSFIIMLMGRHWESLLNTFHVMFDIHDNVNRQEMDSRKYSYYQKFWTF